MSRQGPPNGDRDDPFTAFRKAADESFNSLFSSLIGLPSAIYKQGNDHGKEWARLSRNDREGSSSNSEDDAGSSQSHGGCPYLKNGGPRWEQAQAQKSNDNDDDKVGELVARLTAEMEKGQRKAWEMYNTWSQQIEPGARPVGFGEEVEPAEDKAEERNCRRGGHWWRRRCRRQENENGTKGYPTTATVDEQTTAQNQSPSELESNLSKPRPNDEAFPQMHPFEAVMRSVFGDESRWQRGFDFDSLEDGAASHLDFLLNSWYSPLRLDNMQDLDQQWKARYEDLLRAQAGKELLTEEEIRGLNSDFHYVRRMMQLLNEARSQRGNMSAVADDPDGRMTEEDVYERFLGDAARTLPSAITGQVEGQDFMKPDVLSSLTTTQRHVAADGTVTTKTVLKRHFADGREETEEKIETSQDPTWRSRRQLSDSPFKSQDSPRKSAVVEELKKNDRSQSGKGWFWSS